MNDEKKYGLLLKRVFFFSLIAMLFIVWLSGFNICFDPDEIDMNRYGHANYSFYFSGGRDTGFLGSGKEGTLDPMLRYYGSAFEYLAVGFNKLSGIDGGVNEFNVRHIFNQAFGILTLLFAGLIARRFSGWAAAVFTIWLAFLSPSFAGHFYFNTKDIPFCFGYVSTIYFIIRFLDELPEPTWKTSIWLMLALYFALNIRIGGLILLCYFGLFMFVYLLVNKELLDQSLRNARPILTKCLAVVFCPLVFLVITWPFLLIDPFRNFITAINVVRKFPQKVNSIFDGVMVSSLKLPVFYLPKLVLITTPLLVVALLPAGLYFIFHRHRAFDLKKASLILCSILFPVLYAIITHTPLYCGWRHFLFVYPGICIIAAVGLSEILSVVTRRVYKPVIVLLCLAGVASPLAWSVKNHPYEYTYFNELAGGFKKAYYKYDTDYWMISGKKGVDWLMEHEPISSSGDTVVIGTNMVKFVTYYINKHYPSAKVKVCASGVTGRNSAMWHYAIFNTIFVKPEYLRHYYPLGGTIYAVTIDGLTVTSVLKDTERLDNLACVALRAANYQAADSLFQAHIAHTRDNNPALFGLISVAKAYLGQNEAAITDANKCLLYHISPAIDYNAYCGLGIAYANKGQFALSAENITRAGKLFPGDELAKEAEAYAVRLKNRDRNRQ